MKVETYWGILNGRDLLTCTVEKLKEDSIAAFMKHYNQRGEFESTAIWRHLRERTHPQFFCQKLAVMDYDKYERFRKWKKDEMK